MVVFTEKLPPVLYDDRHYSGFSSLFHRLSLYRKASLVYNLHPQQLESQRESVLLSEFSYPSSASSIILENQSKKSHNTPENYSNNVILGGLSDQRVLLTRKQEVKIELAAVASKAEKLFKKYQAQENDVDEVDMSEVKGEIKKTQTFIKHFSTQFKEYEKLQKQKSDVSQSKSTLTSIQEVEKPDSILEFYESQPSPSMLVLPAPEDEK